MNLHEKFLLLGLLFLFFLPARATHIVGGEFQLTHINGSSYRLSLNMYFDRNNGDKDAIDQTIGVSSFELVNNTRVGIFLLTLKSTTPVNYSTLACTNDALSTDKLVYEAIITLPDYLYNSPNGYYLTWERCCRNFAITNIEFPGNAGQTFYLELPAVVQNNQPFNNSSPALFPPVADYACLNEFFYFEFGGTDPDGDSLVYEMVTPFNGFSQPGNPAPTPSPAPYPLVNWTTGINNQNQIPGNPPLRINARTGLLTLRPTQLGLFVFGVRCSEYRNQVKIGEVRRDFQLLVLQCPQNEKPRIAAKPGEKLNYYQPSDIIKIKAKDNRCVNLFLTDTEPNTALTITAIPVNFATTGNLIPISGGIINQNGILDTLQTTACFPSCLDSEGKVLFVDFILRDNGCSLPKIDTMRVAFQIEPVVNQSPEIKTTAPAPIIRLQPGEKIDFMVNGTDADQDIIALSAMGQGFNLVDIGMSFTPASGRGQVGSAFSWTPDCTGTGQTSYTVDFLITESACKPANPKFISVTIIVDYDYGKTFKPANIFTPNNDGLNDFFAIPNLPDYCQILFTGVKIYSRWGNLVYESKDRNFRWDGKNVSDGIYYYQLLFTSQTYKGTVTLVR